MTLLQSPLVITNSVSWDLKENHMHTHTHAHTFKHANTCTHLPWWSRHGKHLRLEGEKINWHQRNVLKTRHCKLFALHSRLCGAHVYINSLRMEAASFAITLYLLTAFEGHRELHLQPETQLRNAESTGKKERWEDNSRSPEDHRGESPAELACDSAFSQWTLMKPYRILGESWDFDNTFSSPPLPQQKPNAFCFECLVATSPYLIPWVYNCSLACTCPQAATSRPLLPQLPFSARSPILLTFMWRWSLWTSSVFIYSLKRFTITYSGFFFFSSSWL